MIVLKITAQNYKICGWHMKVQYYSENRCTNATHLHLETAKQSMEVRFHVYLRRGVQFFSKLFCFSITSIFLNYRTPHERSCERLCKISLLKSPSSFLVGLENTISPSISVLHTPRSDWLHQRLPRIQRMSSIYWFRKKLCWRLNHREPSIK